MKRQKTGGRAHGTPNKATAEARAAVATLVDGNVDRLQEWLEQIACGVADEHGKFIVPPNPAKAFELLLDVLEYHVPKLSRIEHTGDDGGPIETHMTGLELARRVLFDLDVAERRRN